MNKKFNISFENETVNPEPANSKPANAETELVIYCKIGYFEGLKEAVKKEHHDQYEIKTKQESTGNKGCVRVRKTTSSDGVKFVQTTKVRTEDKNLSISDEHNIDISEENYNAFISIAPSKTIKDRFIFLVKNVNVQTKEGDSHDIQIPEIKYEVDVFPKEEGGYHEWCKIDVEIDPVIEYLNKSDIKIDDFKLNVKVLHLPFKPFDVFIGAEANDEQKLILDNFYQNIFSTKL